MKKQFTGPIVANDAAPIQPMPEVGPKGPSLVIMATLDGYVTLRTPGGDVKLDPAAADQLSQHAKESAKVARHLRVLTAQAPKGLDEQGLIDFITKAFSETPMPEEKTDGHS